MALAKYYEDIIRDREYNFYEGAVGGVQFHEEKKLLIPRLVECIANRDGNIDKILFAYYLQHSDSNYLDKFSSSRNMFDQKKLNSLFGVLFEHKRKYDIALGDIYYAVSKLDGIDNIDSDIFYNCPFSDVDIEELMCLPSNFCKVRWYLDSRTSAIVTFKLEKLEKLNDKELFQDKDYLDAVVRSLILDKPGMNAAEVCSRIINRFTKFSNKKISLYTIACLFSFMIHNKCFMIKDDENLLDVVKLQYSTGEHITVNDEVMVYSRIYGDGVILEIVQNEVMIVKFYDEVRRFPYPQCIKNGVLRYVHFNKSKVDMKPGKMVYHLTFGYGTVFQKPEQGNVAVLFDNKVRIFPYPECVENGILI